MIIIKIIILYFIQIRHTDDFPSTGSANNVVKVAILTQMSRMPVGQHTGIIIWVLVTSQSCIGGVTIRNATMQLLILRQAFSENAHLKLCYSHIESRRQDSNNTEDALCCRRCLVLHPNWSKSKGPKGQSNI